METNVLSAINVSWTEKYGKKCLRIAIHSHFTEQDALEVSSKWKQEFANLAVDEKADIICNCINMTGYDTEARKIYQSTINQLKPQIGYLWVITSNKIFRTAAMTMGFLTKLKIRTADSEVDICAD